MKTLCKYCNNSVKIDQYYMCLGGKKDLIKKFEEDARELKKSIKERK